jgi:O-antigen ligase
MTRITFLALLVAVTVFEFFSPHRLRDRLRAVGLVLAVSLVLIALLLLTGPMQRRFFYSSELGPLPLSRLSFQLNDSGRFTLWAFVWSNYAAGNPVFGQGLGSSSQILRTGYAPFANVAVAHNEYLRLLHDLGIVGLSIFLLAILQPLRVLVAQASRSHKISRQYGCLSLAALSSFLVLAITDNPLDYYMVYGQYVFFFIAIAISKEISDKRHTVAANRRRAAHCHNSSTSCD